MTQMVIDKILYINFAKEVLAGKNELEELSQIIQEVFVADDHLGIPLYENTLFNEWAKEFMFRLEIGRWSMPLQEKNDGQRPHYSKNGVCVLIKEHILESVLELLWFDEGLPKTEVFDVAVLIILPNKKESIIGEIVKRDSSLPFINFSRNIAVLEIRSQYTLTGTQSFNYLPDKIDETNNKTARSIEFPPEYHQAGLDILSYFGTYLRKNYPGENAKVKIEQDGLKVTLIIEKEDGDLERIEKALNEYELIVSRQYPPEKFIDDQALLIEMGGRLRDAENQITMQRQLIQFQNAQIASKTAESRKLNEKVQDMEITMNHLQDILKKGLK